MNIFIDEHIELLKLFIENEVEFIVIGGYAVIYHGYHRTTGDIDIRLRPDNRNKEKVIPAFSKYGIDEKSMHAFMNLDFTKVLAFHIGNEPFKIEFLTFLTGLNFSDAYERRIIANFDDLEIPFLHLEDLVQNKMSTGRLQDEADVEELQKIQKLKQPK